MSYRVEFLKKARRELIEAWTWYEDRQEGLGDRFVNYIQTTIVSIEQNPEHYKEKAKGYRQAAIRVFPYVLIYKIHKQKKIVTIVSVFHTRRKPKRSRKRK